jgi:hypothetical protein
MAETAAHVNLRRQVLAWHSASYWASYFFGPASGLLQR